MEAIVMPNSSIEGWSMRGLRMHERYDVNLLAMSRMGSAPIARLKKRSLQGRRRFTVTG